MTINELTHILDKHGIIYSIVNNKVIANDEYSVNGVLYTDTLDLTYISVEQLYDWLGY
jgi:hypothetical protein